ncbi:putative SH3 and cysteine-rich domain-containing protein [Daphnia magna]|uniref:Putative SH3 and cysteine-rich domain-containing protein n=1 Tax=Daphnia magna TaxID=35525 RepID=A0A164PNF6_9CRUS|nr:putative SH3 and cysteine-rich domain-containing protein [Daphnia magna]
MFTNSKSSVHRSGSGSSGETADDHLELFDFHRAYPSTDEPTLAIRLDPYQQQQLHPTPNQHQHPLQHHPIYLAPSSVTSQQQHPTRSSFSSSSGQAHGSSQRLDFRNLLLAPPAAARNVRDGRGSVSAPATPVDDTSGLVIAASAIATAAVPLNFNVSSSSSSGSAKNNSGLGKFMMKKVNSYSSGAGMAASGTSDCVLRDLIHPAHADALKAHSALAMKLLKTVSDFTQQLATIEEQHGEQLQQLVETFRIRNAELRKERPNGNYGLFQVWETLLQEVEVDSAVVADIANCLNRQVSRPMIDGTFHRKLEARKIFQHREQLENALEKASQQLDKSYQLYDEAYQQHLAAPNTLTLAAYVELHNNYVQDVHAANAMADQFHNVILPQLIQELECVYVDLSKTMTNTIQQGCEAMSERAEGTSSKRYNALANHCRAVNPYTDLATFVRSVVGSSGSGGGAGTGGGGGSVLTIPSSFNKFTFIPPRNPPPGSVSCSQHDIQDASLVLKDELVFDRLAGFSLRTKYESLKKDTAEVEAHVRQLMECMESLTRLQQRWPPSLSRLQDRSLVASITRKKLGFADPLSGAAKCCVIYSYIRSTAVKRCLSWSSNVVRKRLGFSKPPMAIAVSNQTYRFNYTFMLITPHGTIIINVFYCNRSLESNSYNKASELQEEICAKKLEWRMAQLHLAAVKAQNVKLFRLRIVVHLKFHLCSFCVIYLKTDGEQRDLYGTKAEMVMAEVAAASGGSHQSLQQLSSRGSKFNLMAGGSGSGGSGGTGMKTKWMKAFRTLTSSSSSQNVAVPGSTSSTTGSSPPLVNNNSVATDQKSPSSSSSKSERQQQRSSVSSTVAAGASGVFHSTISSSDLLQHHHLMQNPDGQRHVFQENTYKKITPCDVCSQVLRGHSRQGWKCRLCKINVHADCKSGVGRCLPKSRLLRRQKSSSELETTTSQRIQAVNYESQYQFQQVQPQQQQQTEDETMQGDDGAINFGREEIDQTYIVLKQASEMAVSSSSANVGGGGSCNRRPQHHQQQQQSSQLSSSLEQPQQPNVSASDQSLGSSTGAINRPAGVMRINTSSTQLQSGTSSSSRRANPNTLSVGDPSASFLSSSSAPSSPVHHSRRLLLSARNVRMNSVELPDENEKSQSSASASPCPSPKAQRLLPTNLYVVLFNFKGREADELDLKAGYKVTVIDASDPDWWRGKCLGQIGFFPSKYVAKLAPNEKPLQVTHNLQLGGNDEGADSDPNRLTKLLRDQIVIQIGEEQNGMVTVRNGDNKQGSCPTQYLQEV